MTAPLVFRWVPFREREGGAMVPVDRFVRQALQQYAADETYLLGEVEERSEASHKHEFAWLREAWENLPESLADRFPNPESLRKYALIEAGYYTETRLDAGSHAAALRVAAIMSADEPLAMVVVRGPLVVRRIARSQSKRSMLKGEFQESKTKIMEVVAAMIGVAPAELQRASAA